MSLKLNKSTFNKISIRLTLGYAMLFILSSAFILFLNYFLFSRSIQTRDRNILLSKSKEYTSIYLKNGSAELKKYLDEEKQGDLDSQYLVRISSPDGQVIFLRLPENLKKNSPELIEKKLSELKYIKGLATFFLKEGTVEEPDELNEYEVAQFTLTNGVSLQVARNTDDRDDVLERYLGTILIAMLIVLIFGSIGGFIFANQALIPVRNLIQAIKSVRAGALSTRVPVKNSNDELDEISHLFNKMAEKIERLVLNMQETLDSVAHDLRTPLTRLKSKAELTLLNPSTTVADYKTSLVQTIENTSEIVSFINTLMDISEAEVGVLKLNLVQVNSTVIISEILDLYSIVAEEKNIKIEFDYKDEFNFFTDRNRFKQVLSNLIDNAIKYSEENKIVRIATQKNHSTFEISVADQGLGINEHDLPKIWDRLFRSHELKSVKGLGLGLSLVKSICQSHNWKISVKSQHGAGSEFLISIKD